MSWNVPWETFSKRKLARSHKASVSQPWTQLAGYFWNNNEISWYLPFRINSRVFYPIQRNSSSSIDISCTHWRRLSTFEPLWDVIRHKDRQTLLWPRKFMNTNWVIDSYYLWHHSIQNSEFELCSFFTLTPQT